MKEFLLPTCPTCRTIRLFLYSVAAVLLVIFVSACAPQPPSKCYQKNVTLTPEEEAECDRRRAQRTYQNLNIPAYDPNAVPFQNYMGR
jgi:hypothetical protein